MIFLMLTYINFNLAFISSFVTFFSVAFFHGFFPWLFFPWLFSPGFRYNRDIHNIQTRQSSLYNLNVINTKFGQKSLRFVGPKLGNNLPNLIKITKGIHSLKKNIKKVLLQKFKNSHSSI